jgi:hypothetical protein
MRVYSVLAVVLVAWAIADHANAQPVAPPVAGQPRVTPEDLRPPASPVFALLGTTPASIERPQTPRALAMNLISAVREEEGLPRNYALEVAPYWTTYHPDLSFDDYYNAGLLQTIAQTFAVSVATTPLSGEALVAGTRVGVGLRTLLWAGRAHPQLAAAHAELISVDTRIAEATDAIPPLRQQAFDARRAGRIAEADELDRKVAAAEADAERQTADLRRQATEAAGRVGDLDRNRVGFQLALAAGHVWDFPGDRFEQRQAAQWGIWITPAYRISTIDVMAAVRYLADQRGEGDDRTWDVGGRLLWQPSVELAVSVETLRRGGTRLSGGESSNRTVGMLEYRVNEDIVLYGSFGRDFQDLPGARTLVSIVGLNLGFGRKPIVDVAR